MANQVTMKLKMFQRWLRILNGKSATAIPQGIGQCYSKTEISGYYNDLTGKVGQGTLLDDDGLPLTQIGDREFVHFPIAVFQYGLGCYDCHLLSGEAEYLRKTLNTADWALAKMRNDGSWDCFSPLRSEKYTVSSMGQGEGASLLFRAYKDTGNQAYRDAAFRAIEFMLADMRSGGTSFYERDELFLEEYPQYPKRSVLNGWIFSLFGLFDAALVDPSYMVAFKKSTATLSKTLSQYDNGYWSLYDLEGRIASPAYHSVHIALLRALSDITGDEQFENFAIKFEHYENSFWNTKRAFIKKVFQKLTEHSEAVVVQ